MAPRPHWKGYLKLSFVSCPIALYPAVTAAERISYRQVNKRTGNRLRHQLVDAVTGEAVASHDKGRGYEVGESQFLLVADDELSTAKEQAKTRPFIVSPHTSDEGEQAEASLAAANVTTLLVRAQARGDENATPEAADDEEAPPLQPVVRQENTRTIEIERFVPRAQIDARYFEKPYYIVPRGPVAQEAFAVIRESMRGKDVVGIGRVILSSRERPIALEPMGNGLRGVTLRYPYEVRSEAEYFADIPDMKLPPDMIKLAGHIVKTMESDFDPAMFQDRERAAMVELLNKKQRALPKPERSVPSRENIVNLMDALKRSLSSKGVSLAKPRARRSPDVAATKAKPSAKRRKIS